MWNFVRGVYYTVCALSLIYLIVKFVQWAANH